jgi:hypothetical protein
MLEAVDLYPLLQSHKTAVRLAIAELEALYPDVQHDTAPSEWEPKE